MLFEFLLNLHTMNEDLLYTAIENLSKHLTSAINYDFTKNENHKSIDGKLSFKSKFLSQSFSVLFKSNLSISNLSDLVDLSNQFENFIIVSDYISKPLKENLIKKEISYIDTAGNTFIKTKTIFIYIETNKNNRDSFKKKNRAFSPAGLKVVFKLLTELDLISKPYRDIAKEANVSIDTISKVIKELLRDSYVVKADENTYKIRDKERLFQDWVTLFNKNLRPKLKQKSYKTLKNIQDFIPLENTMNYDSLGGELAAQLLTNYLIAENTYLYTEKSFLELAKQHRLIPSEDGNITLIEKFWNTSELSTQLTVNPILVYADLLNNPTPRNIETAQLLYKKYVATTL